MIDTSTDDVFDLVVAVHVDTARFLWCRPAISVNLQLCMSVAGRRSPPPP